MPRGRQVAEAGPKAAVSVAIAALSAAILLLELDLLRIFSFTIWHHFTFMVLSIALLGFGVSGVLLQIVPRLGSAPTRTAARCSAGFGVSALLAVAAVTRIPLDATRVAKEPLQLLGLSAYYLVLLVPFTFAGLGIACLLRGYPRSAPRLYGSDLVGAGIGCVLAVAALPRLGAEGIVFLAAGLALVAAWLLRRSDGGMRWPWLAAAVLPFLAIGAASELLPIPPGPGKGLAKDWLDAARFPSARIAFTRWDPVGRIDVVEGAGVVPWTTHPLYAGPVPEQTQIVIDGDAATPIVETALSPAELPVLDYTLPSVALQAFRPERVLVIGSGGGVDVLTALRQGARHVDAVEIHPGIVDLVTGRYADRTGRLFSRPEVRLHNAEGRAFLRARDDRYGAIVLSLIDTWAASAAGAYSLAEGFLYTVEAFQDYLDRLEPGGVVVITRWRWSPPRETLRLCTVAAEALRREGGLDPGERIVVLGVGGLGSVLIRREPFTEEELSRLRRVAAARGMELLYAPGIVAENEFVGFLRAPDPGRFLASYPYDVSPVTDDDPFFFQFGRWRDANPLGDAWEDPLVVLSGKLVLAAVLAQAAGISLLLLVLPVLFRRSRPILSGPASAPGVLAYFFLIGLSFMLIEIALMQRFTLFLGSPAHATAVVLGGLLLSAGAGSALVPRLLRAGRRPMALFVGIALLGTTLAFFLPAILTAALGLGLAARAAFSVVLLFPLGLLLGAPLPFGISRLEEIGAGPLIGWAWAANGCASVIGPILGALLAMDLGFSAVTTIGAAGYVAAGLSSAAFARPARVA